MCITLHPATCSDVSHPFVLQYCHPGGVPSAHPVAGNVLTTHISGDLGLEPQNHPSPLVQAPGRCLACPPEGGKDPDPHALIMSQLVLEAQPQAHVDGQSLAPSPGQRMARTKCELGQLRAPGQMAPRDSTF